MRQREEYLTYRRRRENDMRSLYNRLLNDRSVNIRELTMRETADLIRNHQAPMVYITPKHAQILIYNYYNNNSRPTRLRGEARARQLWIVGEYERLKKKRAFKHSSIINICKVICSSPAPAFFCEQQKAMKAIFYYKAIDKREYDKKQKELGADTREVCSSYETKQERHGDATQSTR